MKPDGYCLKGPDGWLEEGFFELSEEWVWWAFRCSLRSDRTQGELEQSGYTVVPVRVVEVKSDG